MKTLTTQITIITILTLSQFSMAAVNSTTEAEGPCLACETTKPIGNSFTEIKEVIEKLSDLVIDTSPDNIHSTQIDVTNKKYKHLNAVGQIYDRKTIANGSGFLVKSCLVLTAKHVACANISDTECMASDHEVDFQVGKKKKPLSNDFDFHTNGTVVGFGYHQKAGNGGNWALRNL